MNLNSRHPDRILSRSEELREGRQRWSPWQLGGLTIRALCARAWNETWEDELLDRAGALSFFFLLALFPGLLFLTGLFGLLPTSGLLDAMLGYFGQVMPPSTVELVRSTLTEIRRGATPGLLSVGVLGAIWSASIGMVSVISALNVAYEVADDRPWWKRRLVAIALTLGFSLFTVITLLLLVFGKPLAEGVTAWFGLGQTATLAWKVATWPIVIGSVLAGITLVYYLAPAGGKRWRWITPGSVFALLGWLGVSYLLRLYVGYFGSFSRAYGSIGAVILLMVWFYVSSLTLLVGAEIDSEITLAEAKRQDQQDLERPARPGGSSTASR